MSWNMKWEGRATEHSPELVAVVGKPGRLAKACQDAMWEALQGLATQNPHTYARVTANGWEDPEEVGLGSFNLTVAVIAEPGEIQERLKAQQPVDLTSRSGAVTPASSEPASSA